MVQEFSHPRFRVLFTNYMPYANFNCTGGPVLRPQRECPLPGIAAEVSEARWRKEGTVLMVCFRWWLSLLTTWELRWNPWLWPTETAIKRLCKKYAAAKPIVLQSMGPEYLSAFSYLYDGVVDTFVIPYTLTKNRANYLAFSRPIYKVKMS